MTTSCEDNPSSATLPPTSKATDFAFVITTNFQTGSASVIWFDGAYTTVKNVNSVHSDAVARFHGGLIYVVNRFGADNIQILDPANGFATVRQFSVENGADPHDIAVVSGTKAYVTRYNKTDLWIVDPSSGMHTGSIDLSTFADADGVPEMDRLAVSGDYLFVSIQRLDRNNHFTPAGASLVAVVSVAADTLVDTDPAMSGIQPIMLTASNPFSDFETDPTTNDLLLACAGAFGLQDGGVDVVSVKNLASEGLLLTESAAGGDITDVEILSASLGYVVTTDANFSNVLLSFNPQMGIVSDTLYAPGAFVLQDVEPGPTGILLLADRTPTNPGIRIYDTTTGTETTSIPIDVGLPPFDITIGAVEKP